MSEKGHKTEASSLLSSFYFFFMAFIVAHKIDCFKAKEKRKKFPWLANYASKEYVNASFWNQLFLSISLSSNGEHYMVNELKHRIVCVR